MSNVMIARVRSDVILSKMFDGRNVGRDPLAV